MAKGIITEIGRRKLCKAHAGDEALPKIMKMAFGNGGTDSEGNVIETSGKETSLRSELLKRDVDGHSYVGTGEMTCRYSLRLSKQELANENISEQGLFDEAGDMIAYKTFLPKGKDDDMEFVFDMDEIF